MMLTHCGNNVRNRYSGCVFSVKDIVPVPLKTSRNPDLHHNSLIAPGSIPRSLLRTFNFEIWKLKCLGACPEDLYLQTIYHPSLRSRLK